MCFFGVSETNPAVSISNDTLNERNGVFPGSTGGAKVLSNLSVSGRPTILDNSRARAIIYIYSSVCSREIKRYTFSMEKHGLLFKVLGDNEPSCFEETLKNSTELCLE